MEKIIDQCPVTTTLSIINSRWRVYIIHELTNGAKRNSELLRLLPKISQKVLTENLRMLEDERIIERIVYPVLPPKVEYRLTGIGRTLLPLIDNIYSWGTLYQERINREA